MRTPRTSPMGPARPAGRAAGAEAPAPPPVRGRRAHAGPPADESPADTVDGPPAPAPARAWRHRLRPRTVRARIVCLLMVPAVSLLALWAHVTVTTAQDVARLRQVQRVETQVRAPVGDAVAALQAERTAAVRRATDPSAVPAGDYAELSARTDRAVGKLRLGEHGTVADSGELPVEVARRLEAFVTGAENLGPLRTAVRDRAAGWEETFRRYTAVISTGFGAGGALSGVQDAGAGSDARVLAEFARAGEALAQEDAVLAGVRPGGGLDGARLRLFAGAVGARRALTESAAADLRGPDRTAWRELAGSRAYTTVRAAEDGLLGAGTGGAPAGTGGAPAGTGGAPAGTGGAPAGAAARGAWDTAHAQVRDGMRRIEQDAGRGVARRADPFTRGVLTPAGAVVLFGLPAVAASLVISVRIGRALVVELVSLRDSALEIARHKLPEAMRRLRAGEDIDVGAEAPPGKPAEDETGQVAEALGTVHRAALRAAVERAELADGISGVFVNLARRSQVLVHRQLSLLDSMERRSDDPDELGDLFRLDHLTTRMRRHAESLIILSGAAPGRAWRRPVPLTDVVRAAVSEIEDYARVELRRLPEASVVGAAVADLIHLVAELLENAAQFSPPHTRVSITGEPVGNGYALEVEDRGLGMGSQALAEANHRIARSEALDLFDSDRLGLFVVSRLAARHGIKVHLRTSPYGGTTAVVLLPTALLHDEAAEGSPAGAGLPAGRIRPAPDQAQLAPGQAQPSSEQDRSSPGQARLTAVQARSSSGEVPPPPGRSRPPRGGARHLPAGARQPEQDDGPRGHGPAHRPPAAVPLGQPAPAPAGRPAPTAPAAAPAPPAPAPAPAVPVHPTADTTPPSPHPGAPAVRPHRSPDGSPGFPGAPGPDGLPRRVRQASLAPQLRGGRPEEQARPRPPHDHGPGHIPDERTPELVRDRMAAYRDGWTRGGGRRPGRRPPPGAAATRDSSEGDPA
ncbi:nitrate- and nitrite sensing domain-containing protein [Streptomyces sp. NPDC006367]|uniref:nitrate- and nitrite sensing domain-containing protein n=1 Tax=unclassified Streptomyces TaxID=2593676 RepID=UPI0033A65209